MAGLTYSATVVARRESEKKMRRYPLLLAFAIVCSSQATAVAADLSVGDTAPPFELAGSDGKTYSLSQFKGKQAVVVAWFPKAFTGG